MPEDIETLLKQTGELRMNGEYNQSISLCDKIIEHNPNFALAFFSRAWSKMLLKEFDSAIIDLNKAIELDHYCFAFYYFRSGAKKKIKDYKGAILDYILATFFLFTTSIGNLISKILPKFKHK